MPILLRLFRSAWDTAPGVIGLSWCGEGKSHFGSSLCLLISANKLDAKRDNGTRCLCPFLVRIPGISQTSFSRSNSAHGADVTSPRRCDVTSMNFRDNLTPSLILALSRPSQNVLISVGDPPDKSVVLFERDYAPPSQRSRLYLFTDFIGA